MCVFVHMSELLELELQAVVSTLTDMLETELATSEVEQELLTIEPSPSPVSFIFESVSSYSLGWSELTV